MAKAGLITPATAVRREDSKWAKASEVRGLFAQRNEATGSETKDRSSPEVLTKSTEASETLSDLASAASEGHGSSVSHSSLQPRTHRPTSSSRNTRRSPTRSKRKTPPSSLPVSMAILGTLLGCVIGFYAAHHFAFFGGINLIGEPYSPARDSLVPGHMLLCGGVLGISGFGIGLSLRKTN